MNPYFSFFFPLLFKNFHDKSIYIDLTDDQSVYSTLTRSRSRLFFTRMPFDVELHERARQIGKGLIGALENCTNTRRPDNRVTFVIFHARRREQIRHAARYLHSSMTRVLSSSFLSLSLCFRAIKFLLVSLKRRRYTHTRLRFDFFNQRSFLPSSRVACLRSLSFSRVHPSARERRKIFDPLNSRLVPRSVQGFPF